MIMKMHLLTELLRVACCTIMSGHDNDKHFVKTDLLGFSARAVLELVGPIRLRHSLMAFCLAKTSAYTGPLVIKLTSVSKKPFPLCSP